jgi:ADP-ribose pyrophosphatase YjhB (NUDIX family)
MKYCPECGTVLEVRQVEGRERAFCPDCEPIYYTQLKVGAGAIIERDGRLLLLRRTGAPFQGCWNLPTGYVESDESPVQAVVREAYEETGLRVEASELVDVYFFDDDPRGNGILIVYACRPEGGELSVSEEGSEATFFLRSDLLLELAGGGHDQAVSAWRMSLGGEKDKGSRAR